MSDKDNLAIGDFNRAIQNPGVVLSREFRIRHKDGSWRIVESRSRSLLDNPAVAGVLVNIRDLTQSRQKEQ